MKSKFNRLLSVLLLVCMLASFAPAAYAEEPANVEEPVSVDETVSTEGTPAADGTAAVEDQNLMPLAEHEEEDIPEAPAKPGISNTTKELFVFHCTNVEEHEDITYNWFGSYVQYNGDMKYDETRGVYTATAKITNVQVLLSSGVKCPDKVWGHKHYHTDADGKTVRTATLNLVWDPEATGLNSASAETTGLWLPDGKQAVNVWCYEQPALPSAATIATQFSKKLLWLRDYDNTKNNWKPTSTQLKVSPYKETYTLSDLYSVDGTFYVDLTITDFTPYLDYFNAMYSASEYPYGIDWEHTTADFTYRLKYATSTTPIDYKQDGSGWTADFSASTSQEKLNGKTLFLTNHYTVTYTDGVENEDLFEDQVYEVGNGEPTPAFNGTPTREGYKFIGWSPDLSETVTKTTVYTAQWAAEYTLSVKPENGEEDYELVYTELDKISDKLETPVWEGRDFTGWVDQNGDPVDVDALYTPDLESVTAVWSLVNYPVTIDPANGEEHTKVNYTYEDVIGDKYDFSKDPVWEGHTFTGWVDQDGNPVDLTATYTEELTSITGTWKLTEYVVPVDPANGEDVTDVTYTYVDVIGDKYDFSKDPTRRGYTFKGWVDQDGNPVDLKATYTEDIESINGSWKGKTYTVTFKLEEDEGTLSFTEKKVVNGDPLGYTPKVEREGYTFIGWYDEYGKYYNSQTIFDAARDVTLTGRWTKTIVPTGDDSDPALFALMMLGSLACAGAIIIRLRKREDQV